MFSHLRYLTFPNEDTNANPDNACRYIAAIAPVITLSINRQHAELSTKHLLVGKSERPPFIARYQRWPSTIMPTSIEACWTKPWTPRSLHRLTDLTFGIWPCCLPSTLFTRFRWRSPGEQCRFSCENKPHIWSSGPLSWFNILIR